MSGIFGAFLLNGSRPRIEDLAPIGKAMAYRGPDGGDIYLSGPAGLGHLMLRSTPQAADRSQPWRDPDSQLCITADARLDNRRELLLALSLSAAGPGCDIDSPVPDSRLILRAYCLWGENCVDHLLGDFAFAIWDERGEKLFCARDHLGIKPFCYHASPKGFTFASSARAIVFAPSILAQLNEGRIADYLTGWLEGINKTVTFFSGVYRLPPAHSLSVENGSLKLRQYWTLNQQAPLQLHTDTEYLEAFDEVFTTAVTRRLQGGVGVASMLSGGVDSSAIVGIARRSLMAAGAEPLKTISGVSNGAQGIQEHLHIRKVLQGEGLQSALIHEEDFGAQEAQLAGVFQMMEEPFDSLLTLPASVYLKARSLGHTAVLDGVDGDLVASLSPGYPAILLRAGEFSRAWSECRGLCQNFYRDEQPWSVFLGLLRTAVLPDRVRRAWWWVNTRRYQREILRDSLLCASFARRVDLLARSDEMELEFGSAMPETLQIQHINRVLPAYLTAAVERYERVAAYCGVEHRKPFLDKDLIEFCVALPWDQKVRNGWSKYLLRKLAETVVPTEVAWRRGSEHAGWEFTRHWMMRHRGSNIVLLHSEAERLEPYVDMDKFSALLGAYECGEGECDTRLWRALNLLQWLRRNDI